MVVAVPAAAGAALPLGLGGPAAAGGGPARRRAPAAARPRGHSARPAACPRRAPGAAGSEARLQTAGGGGAGSSASAWKSRRPPPPSPLPPRLLPFSGLGLRGRRGVSPAGGEPWCFPGNCLPETGLSSQLDREQTSYGSEILPFSDQQQMKRLSRKCTVSACSPLKFAFVLWDEGHGMSGDKRPCAFYFLYAINRDGKCKTQVAAVRPNAED